MTAILDISNHEANEIIQLVYNRYGYDFSGYALGSIKRRISRFLNVEGIKNIFELKHLLINKEEIFTHFMESITVNVTEMFRDPGFYQILRQQVIPMLATYPHIKIWVAGCSTGEEAYSIAILLKEAGILEKSIIYATDINATVLRKAEAGIISPRLIKEYTLGYQAAGGCEDFSKYYVAKYDNVILNEELRSKIVFAVHNLVSDQSFNEFHFISCRNVLIYFNKDLQNNVIKLFSESICRLGFLALGSKESLVFMPNGTKFDDFNRKERIYRLK